MSFRLPVTGAVVCAASVMAVGVPVGQGGTAEYVCQASPVTHRLPDPWMKNLSRDWVHVGTLWMGYTLADRAFTADPDGQKIAWWRSKGSAYGKLRISGYRLDASAPPLKAWIPTGYATRVGFQSTGLYFSTPGCWRVVAHVGLTQTDQFTINVIAKP